MIIHVYSDESGVFDKVHNDFFIFAGLIFWDKDREICNRKFIHEERNIRIRTNAKGELKASKISNRSKSDLFRALNQYHKFCCIIREKDILPQIYNDKKTKQRYLDYAYKIAVKRAFESYLNDGILDSDVVETIHFHTDEHTTATNGRYELREALEQEFRFGTYNRSYSRFYPPIFPKVKNIRLDLCDSANVPLVRAADIIANRIYFLANSRDREKIRQITNLHTIYLP